MNPRLTGGQFKGRMFMTPQHIRATEAKVRQALYNIFGSWIEGTRVLDGYAGSGVLGFEALSRGAGFVAFLESDTDAVLCIRENLVRFDSELPREAWQILHLAFEVGVRHLAKTGSSFDLVLLDPPYRSEEGKKALNAVVEYAILAPAGWLVIEHEQRTTLPLTVGPLQQAKRHRYGDTVLSFYQAASSLAPREDVR